MQILYIDAYYGMYIIANDELFLVCLQEYVKEFHCITECGGKSLMKHSNKIMILKI